MHTIFHCTKAVFLKLYLTAQRHASPEPRPNDNTLLAALSLGSSHQRSPQQLRSYAGVSVIISVMLACTSGHLSDPIRSDDGA